MSNESSRRSRTINVLIAMLASALCLSWRPESVRADDIRLFGSAAVTGDPSNGWNFEELALGQPGAGETGDQCRNRDIQNRVAAQAPFGFEPNNFLQITNFDNYPANGQCIDSVAVAFYGSWTDSVTGSVTLEVLGTGVNFRPAAFNITGGCAWQGNLIVPAPAGGWTRAAVNSLRMNLKRTSATTPANKDLFCSGVRLRVVSSCQLAITQNPQAASVCEGGQAAFSAAASGCAPIAYQWFYNGGAIPGQINPMLVLSGVGAGSAGTYFCRINNGCAVIDSASAGLTVNPLPAPIGGGGERTPCAGDIEQLHQDFSNATSYQWLFNNTPIGGATASDFQAVAAGMYVCVGSNSCGSTNGPPFVLRPRVRAMAAQGAQANPSKVCSVGVSTVNLTAFGGSGDVLVWYVLEGGTKRSIGEGNPLSVPAPSINTTYAARWETRNGCPPAADVTCEVSTVSPLSIPPSVFGTGSICVGEPAFLAANCFGNSVVWRVQGSSTIIGDGSSALTVYPSESTTYCATCTNQCGEGPPACVPVTVLTRLPAPAPITFDPPCAFASDTGLLLLSAAAAPGQPVSWVSQDVQTGAQMPLGVGNPLAIPVPQRTTLFLASQGPSGPNSVCPPSPPANATFNVAAAPRLPVQQQPFDRVLLEGENATFEFLLTEQPGTAYQWFFRARPGAPLAPLVDRVRNSVRSGIAGSQTRRLRILGVGAADEGEYICEASFNPVCGQRSEPARIILTCPADIDRDGRLTPDDLSDYIACYFSPPCAAADFNRDGNIDPDDLSDYISAFFVGCP